MKYLFVFMTLLLSACDHTDYLTLTTYEVDHTDPDVDGCERAQRSDQEKDDIFVCKKHKRHR